MVLGTTRFRAALDWYLDTLGLIVPTSCTWTGIGNAARRWRSSAATWAACPPTTHTLAMALQPQTGYVHSAYELTDLDEVAASGQYLRDRGYRHAWGLGGHIQGSQIFELARPGPGDVRALHRRRRVRRRDGARLGSAVGQRPGPVGPEGDRGVHRHQRSIPASAASGVAELAAAAGILIGLWWHPLGLAAAAGMTLLLLGALITHRRAADSGKEMAPALAALAITIAYLAIALTS